LLVKTLVIGYGNTLRRDDGVGYRAAEAVETWHLDHVQAYPCHQLTPELAATMASVDRVIFIDATLPQNPPHPILVERLRATPSATVLTSHHSSPLGLLALTHQLYHQSPTAYELLLPTWTMDYGEALSPMAQRGLVQGLRYLRQLLQQPL
jgi:hydrogenase maturation protease